MNNLEVTGINLERYNKKIIDDLSFSMSGGEILVISGENGSGKTTLMRMIAGLLQPDSGEIKICGHTYFEGRAVARYVGFAPEQFGVYSGMRVRDYLDYYAHCAGLSGLMARRKVAALIDEFGLTGMENVEVSKMALGLKQKVSLVRCLAHDPKVLVLDEPINSLDPEGRVQFANIIKRKAGEGCSIIISSHNLSQLEGLCTYIAFMKNGQMPIYEKREELMKRFVIGTPISIVLAYSNQMNETLSIIRPLPYVKSISIENNNLIVKLVEIRDAEQKLLKVLLDNNIATLSFGRENPSLEELFVMLNREEKHE